MAQDQNKDWENKRIERPKGLPEWGVPPPEPPSTPASPQGYQRYTSSPQPQAPYVPAAPTGSHIGRAPQAPIAYVSHGAGYPPVGSPPRRDRAAGHATRKPGRRQTNTHIHGMGFHAT